MTPGETASDLDGSCAAVVCSEIGLVEFGM